tara:strand:- start:1058 stop:1498 length:441 start_codon:yes stop_codon:yes gene_type:complete
MKWYFASRMRHKESIEKIINFLKSQDQQVVYEWSKLGSLKPYNENSNKSSLVAKEIGDALKNVDIFILVADEAGTDMFIELGIVIGRWLDNNKTKIYAVGKFNDRSLMHFHPAIKQVDKLSDVFSIECPELLTQEGAALLTSFDPM